MTKLTDLDALLKITTEYEAALAAEDAEGDDLAMPTFERLLEATKGLRDAARHAMPVLIRELQLARTLVEAVRRYRRSLQQGMPVLRKEGMGSLPFQAKADQTNAAWQDVKTAILALHPEDNSP